MMIGKSEQKVHTEEELMDEEINNPKKIKSSPESDEEGVVAKEEGVTIDENQINNNNDSSNSIESPKVEDKKEQQQGEETMVYRIRLENINKYWMPKDLKKMCEKVDLPNIKIKKAPNWAYAYLSFNSVQEQENAISKLSGQCFKKDQELVIRKEAPIAIRQFGKSNDQNDGRLHDKNKNIQENDNRTPKERLADQVTPFWRLDYAEQLDMKMKGMVQVMKKLNGKLKNLFFNKDIDRHNRDQLKWVMTASQDNNGLPCQLNNTVPSPSPIGYRNKCEFSFGMNEKGEKSLGFLLGLFKDGITTVMAPNDCLHVDDTTKNIVFCLEKYVIEKSELGIYDRNSQVGFWRLVQTRTYSSGEVMVVVQINPTGIERQVVESEKQKLTEYLVAKKEATTQEIQLTTLLFQESDGAFNGFTDKHPMTVVYGPGYAHESLLGVKFRISPTAFFQVNTAATELLYGHIRELCMQRNKDKSIEEDLQQQEEKEEIKELQELQKEKTLVLDLCCGTGTIGQMMASKVDRVVGVEMIQEAVEDAKKNAELNGITNADYICKKVEEAIRFIIKKYVFGSSFQSSNSYDNNNKNNDADNIGSIHLANASNAAAEVTSPHEEDVVAKDNIASTEAEVTHNDDNSNKHNFKEDVPEKQQELKNKEKSKKRKRMEEKVDGGEQQPEYTNVIAILDPPREGVHSDVIRAIRGCKYINRVIYVSCNPDAALSNFVDLCRPPSNKFPGPVFQPQSATPFDLFPQTKHCELVIDFKRRGD